MNKRPLKVNLSEMYLFYFLNLIYGQLKFISCKINVKINIFWFEKGEREKNQ